jgi:hypothetical protein
MELKLKVDVSEVRDLLGLLAEFHPAALIERGTDSVYSFLLHFLDAFEEFFCIDGNGLSTPGTNELVFRLKPTDGFRSRVLAFRTRKADFGSGV